MLISSIAAALPRLAVATWPGFQGILVSRALAGIAASHGGFAAGPKLAWRRS